MVEVPLTEDGFRVTARVWPGKKFLLGHLAVVVGVEGREVLLAPGSAHRLTRVAPTSTGARTHTPAWPDALFWASTPVGAEFMLAEAPVMIAVALLKYLCGIGANVRPGVEFLE